MPGAFDRARSGRRPAAGRAQSCGDQAPVSSRDRRAALCPCPVWRRQTRSHLKLRSHGWISSNLGGRKTMAMTDRRSFIQAAAALPMTVAATGAAFAQAPSAPPAAQAKPPVKDVTRELAHYIVTATYDDLPANVRKEGV